MLVFVLDAHGRVVAADAAAAFVVKGLAITNAFAARTGRDVVFTVHDAVGVARARWRLVPIPRTPGGHADGAAWTILVEREPDGAPGRREAETLAMWPARATSSSSTTPSTTRASIRASACCSRADDGAVALRNVRLPAACALVQTRAEAAAAIAQIALDAKDAVAGAVRSGRRPEARFSCRL